MTENKWEYPGKLVKNWYKCKWVAMPPNDAVIVTLFLLMYFLERVGLHA